MPKEHSNLSSEDREIVIDVFTKSNDFKLFVPIFENMNSDSKYLAFFFFFLRYAKLRIQKDTEQEFFPPNLNEEKNKLEDYIYFMFIHY